MTLVKFSLRVVIVNSSPDLPIALPLPLHVSVSRRLFHRWARDSAMQILGGGSIIPVPYESGDFSSSGITLVCAHLSRGNGAATASMAANQSAAPHFDLSLI